MSTTVGVALPLTRVAAACHTIRGRALWALLIGGVVGGVGVGWDVRWHLLIGRDSFWIPPHVMIYASVVTAAVIPLGVLLLDTRAARSGAAPLGAVTVLGLVGTRGFHLAWWGLALTLTAAPIDDLWHRVFGIDVTIWSPPHLLGFAGAAVHGVGCLRIALEAWPAGHWARGVAMAAGGALMLGDFQILSGPALQMGYRPGGPFFYTYAVVGGALFAFALTLSSRLGGHRLLPLVVVAGAAALQLATLAVADIGFALLQPVAAIREAIAADPTSPIAVAWEMAQRSGEAQPGRGMSLRVALLVPAALMAVADVGRRPLTAALAFGIGLLLASGAVLGHAPAFADVLPSPTDTIVGVPLALLAALLGTAASVRLADHLGRDLA